MVKYFDEKEFILGKKIGSGGDGVVKFAQHIASKRECAIKLIPLDEDSEFFFESEREIMEELNKYNHKNILFSHYFVNKDNSEGYYYGQDGLRSVGICA